jgi:hypothetical protein
VEEAEERLLARLAQRRRVGLQENGHQAGFGTGGRQR